MYQYNVFNEETDVVILSEKCSLTRGKMFSLIFDGLGA